MNLVRAAATVGSFTLLSRLTGFVRDMLTAALLGAGPLADAFFVAFKLANFLRRLFGEGAFNAGFVPLLARTIEGEGKEEGRRFAQEAFALMATVLLAVVVVVELIMPWFIRGLLAHGLIGLFIGPIVLALGYELLRAWALGPARPKPAAGT